MADGAMIRVLVIDDEVGFCYFTKENLEQMGPYQVKTASGAHEGLLIAQRERPDVILLDIMMPEMDGFEILERLKKDVATSGIPVLMLTALGDPQSKQIASGLYNDDYIVKPVASEILKSRIDKALERIGRRPLG